MPEIGLQGPGRGIVKYIIRMETDEGFRGAKISYLGPFDTKDQAAHHASQFEGDGLIDAMIFPLETVWIDQ